MQTGIARTLAQDHNAEKPPFARQETDKSGVRRIPTGIGGSPQGRTPGCGRKAAHPNSRFTAHPRPWNPLQSLSTLHLFTRQEYKSRPLTHRSRLTRLVPVIVNRTALESDFALYFEVIKNGYRDCLFTPTQGSGVSIQWDQERLRRGTRSRLVQWRNLRDPRSGLGKKTLRCGRASSSRCRSCC